MKLTLYIAVLFFGLQAIPSMAQSFAAPPPTTAPPPSSPPPTAPPSNSPQFMEPSVNSSPVIPPPALPSFTGAALGVAKIHPIVEQRHQALTLLYREALDVLRQDPGAADIPDCPGGEPEAGEICIRNTKKSAKASSTQKKGEAKKEADKKAALLEAAKKGATVVEQVVPAPVEARKIAILFGNNAYANKIPVLETPIADVQEIGKILHDRFGYEVRIVKDARKADMVTALNQIGSETKFGDSVMVAYAGHGYLMESTKMGYWIPVDGTTKSPANWVSNSDISKFLKNIPAKQIILISDSCYSGTLTKEEKITAATKTDDREAVLTRRSVLTMSSGGDEPVSDEGKEGHSIFAWSMIGALKSLGSVTPGAQLFQKVKKEVLKAYPQEPQYGAVLSAGHKVGGDYFFEAPAK